MAVSRFEVYLVNLDPTVGVEIRKTRPCLAGKTKTRWPSRRTASSQNSSCAGLFVDRFLEKAEESFSFRPSARSGRPSWRADKIERKKLPRHPARTSRSPWKPCHSA
jgi:hypothetical protein